jgi:Rieske Fe-S protein
MTEERKKVLNRQYEKAKTNPELMEKYQFKRRQRKINRINSFLADMNIDRDKLNTRVCAHIHCSTILSRYNSGHVCNIHESQFNLSEVEDFLRKNHAISILAKEKAKA